MTSYSETTVRIHSADTLTIYTDTWGDAGMTVTVVVDNVGNTPLRLSAADTADLHNLLMRMLTAVASTAARERPDEPEAAEEPTTLPPCDNCGEGPVILIDGDVLCAGCELGRAGVGT